jgi:O-antigen/teichoic acid export membrane protein
MHETVPGSAPVRRVARGSVTAFAIITAGVGLTYCSQLLIARVVGVDTYGIYAYVIAWIGVLAYFSALGFDVALLRFVPAYHAEKSWALLRGVVQYAQRRAIMVGVMVMLVGMLVIMARRIDMGPADRNTFIIGFMMIPLWALLWIRCSVVRAFGGVVSAVAPERVIREGMLIGIVALAGWGLKLNVDAPLLMLATVVSTAVALGPASLAMGRLRPGAINDVSPIYAAATWRRVALPLVIIGAGEALMNRTGVLLLGWFGDTRSAGIYNLAFNIAFVAALPRTAVNTLFAPTISSLFARKDQAMMQLLCARAASWTLCSAACIALVLAVFAELVLRWFGPGFSEGVPALRILLLGQVIAASAGSQQYVMTMTGHERSAAAILILSACANAIFSVTLINLIGLTGAAISMTGALIVWNLTMALFLWRRLQLVPGMLALFRSPRAREDPVRDGALS